MGHHRAIAGLVRHIHCFDGLAQRRSDSPWTRTCTRTCVSRCPAEPRGVGDEQIIANQLAARADKIGENLPAVPIVLRHAVLDRDDRVVIHEPGEIARLLLGGADGAFTVITIGAVLEELGRGTVERKKDVAARRKPALPIAPTMKSSAASAPGRFDKTAFVADIGVWRAALSSAFSV